MASTKSFKLTFFGDDIYVHDVHERFKLRVRVYHGIDKLMGCFGKKISASRAMISSHRNFSSHPEVIDLSLSLGSSRRIWTERAFKRIHSNMAENKIKR